MTVELWYGTRPKNPGEQNVLIELFDFLKHRDQHYIMMCDFRARRGNEIDLVILKKDGIFLAELKHCWNPVIGDREGGWKSIEQDGSERTFRNPFKQVMSCSHNWREWFEGNLDQILESAPDSSDTKPYWPFLYIVFYPDLHSDSKIDIEDHPVLAMGLEKFRTVLPIRSDSRYCFETQGMRKIPELLKLTRWYIDPPRSGRDTIPLDAGDIQPPVVRMLVPRHQSPMLKAFHIERDEIIIGRDPNTDLAINNESMTRKHAKICCFDGRWTVTDLNSLNGTFVSYNGDLGTERKVEGTNALKNGSIVRFGEISYTVILDE
jgi:hypothetical protein